MPKKNRIGFFLVLALSLIFPILIWVAGVLVDFSDLKSHNEGLILSLILISLYMILFVFAVRAGLRSYRREIRHAEELETMLQKEGTHMQAILASAAAYVDANLTKDQIFEHSYDYRGAAERLGKTVPDLGKPESYSRFQYWWATNMTAENADRYLEISHREYLLSCFERGERRASVTFSTYEDGNIQPCREVFYLHQDQASGDILCFCVIYDLTEAQRKEREFRQMEDELRMSRIHNFTSQMQPHFLYNALGSIQEIVLDDPEYASELIGDFTTHLRSCIRTMSSDHALPFSQELENIRAYVNIEKMRFGEKLKVEYDIQTEDFPILPLSIQPIVENAIRHGIYARGPKGGTVTIRSRKTEDSYLITVEDDGVGFDVEALMRDIENGRRDSTGLKNLIFRLDKLMHAEVEIHSEVGVGTTVTVKVPGKDYYDESHSSG